MICHYKKIVTVPVNPSLGDKHLEAYNAGLVEIFEEVESEGAVFDIQTIKNQDVATLLYATIADLTTVEMTQRAVNVIILDVHDVRSRIKR